MLNIYNCFRLRHVLTVVYEGLSKSGKLVL